MARTPQAPVERHFGDVRVPMLIAMAGLPGTGKSTIAEVLGARLGGTVISVDPIELSILKAGIDDDQPTGLAAYLVAETMAEKALNAGGTVVVDAVNAVEPARLLWRDLAVRCGVQLRMIEVVCSDDALHRKRLEKRALSLPRVATWHAVEQSLDELAPWTGQSASLARVTIDTVEPIGSNIDIALAFIGA